MTSANIINSANDKVAFSIGPWDISAPSILAPMAGVTDEPFRHLCRTLGAGMTTSEMVTANEGLWHSRKSQQRLASGNIGGNSGKPQPRSVQLAGNDPTMLAAAAKSNEAMGADIIDLNMGCPAKKVCKKAAGSALLRDEALVERILTAVTEAVSIPVTLKIRTGWSTDQRNGVKIANIAEQCGIAALAVHGRTRACAFKGKAEYDTIASIVSKVSIPVFANGDICTVESAQAVLDYTGAHAVMIGRAAQGNPWLFREINHFLASGEHLPAPKLDEVRQTLCSHINALHQFYGEFMGVKIARKHVGWYLKHQTVMNTHTTHEDFRRRFNQIEFASEQHQAVHAFFEQLLTTEEIAA